MKSKCKLIYPMVAMLFVGCASFSLNTAQSPKVLNVHENVYGVSVLPVPKTFYDTTLSAKSLTYELFGRFGQFEKVDFGLKMGLFASMFPYFYLDGKYQFISDPIFSSLILGVSFAPNFGIVVYTLHSTLLFGKDYLYAGAKFNYNNFLGPFPGAVLGCQIGPKQIKILPELNIYWYQSMVMYVPSLSFRLNLSK
ncbi:MAG: hypothetical protein PHG23_02780 [Candidatus Pacebacteria bacterium]|nr:hypothetical protein [Candidatus Paceibacterota bacterium]